MELNITLLVFSSIICFLYLIYVENTIGERSSISAYAKDLTENGLSFLTYVFIWLGLCFPLAWVADHWLTTIAAAFLTLDGLFTGYNPKHLSRKWQDIIHVIGVNVAILLFIVGIFLMNWRIFLYTSPIGLYSIYMLIRKVHRYTYWIEITIIVWIITFLTIEKVILY